MGKTQKRGLRLRPPVHCRRCGDEVIAPVGREQTLCSWCRMPDDVLRRMKGDLRRHMQPEYVSAMERQPAPFSPEEDKLIEAAEIERAADPLDVENTGQASMFVGFRSSGVI